MLIHLNPPYVLLRPRSQHGPAQECQYPGCKEPASVTEQWQTATMPAPSFWYWCRTHAPKATLWPSGEA